MMADVLLPPPPDLPACNGSQRVLCTSRNSCGDSTSIDLSWASIALAGAATPPGVEREKEPGHRLAKRRTSNLKSENRWQSRGMSSGESPHVRPVRTASGQPGGLDALRRSLRRPGLAPGCDRAALFDTAADAAHDPACS